MSKTINLRPFCDPKPGKCYPGIVRPFQFPDNPWRYATDGYIVVRVLTTSKRKSKAKEKTPRSVLEFPWPPTSSVIMEPWPKAVYRTRKGCTCRECKGNDYKLASDCEYCDEDGYGYLQRIGKAVIRKRYDALIRALPDVRWTLVDFPYSSPLVAFRFTGGEGLCCQLIPEGTVQT